MLFFSILLKNITCGYSRMRFYCIHTIYVFIKIEEIHHNTIVGVQANFRVSYSNRVITRVKCIDS